MLSRKALWAVAMVSLFLGCRSAPLDRPALPNNAAAFDAARFSHHTFEAYGVRLPYRLFVPPAYHPARSYPLVLWLHGASGRGSDNQRQLTSTNRSGPAFFTYPAHQERFPAFVLAPQAPEGELWAGGYSTGPSARMQAVMELLATLEREYAIDRNRIYVVGQSMGGFGAWAFAAEYPDRFAAAVPLCGGSHPSKAQALTKTPIWAFHGSADTTVPVHRSREIIRAIEAAGGSPRYTEYQGVGHDVWNWAFAEPDFLPWLFARHRGQEVQPTTPPATDRRGW